MPFGCCVAIATSQAQPSFSGSDGRKSFLNVVEMFLKSAPVDSKFPWYKERLQVKYLRALSDRQQLSGALDGRRWRFLSPGLEDFRDGGPSVQRALYSQGKCGTSPAVFSMPKPPCAVKVPQTRWTKEQTCYSKQNPQSQTQRRSVDAAEQRLTQRPLRLQPHPRSLMTAELFGEVLSVLDPADVSATSPANDVRTETHSPPSAPREPETTANRPRKEKCKDARPTNPYKWHKSTETGVKDQMSSLKDLQEDKLMITRDFCEWIHSLGGETSDLTESTILDLFKSDYEKKPVLSPITETDSTKSPVKLHSSAGETLRVTVKACKPNRAQTSEAWKKFTSDPLRTPSDITDRLEVEGQLSDQDKELKESHGIQAFRQFLVDKGVGMPRFLRVLFSEEEQKYRNRTSNSSSCKRRAVH